MKLDMVELSLLNESLNLKIDDLRFDIDEINNASDSTYESELARYRRRGGRIVTIEEIKTKKTNKIKAEIEKVEELKRTLFRSDHYVLVVSNLLHLTISDH